MHLYIMPAIGAVAFCTAFSTAHANPSISSTRSLRSVADMIKAADTVAYRRCWWRKGKRYCRRYGSAHYPYYGTYRFGYSGSSVDLILGIQ
jgi:hypothetical protein